MRPTDHERVTVYLPRRLAKLIRQLATANRRTISSEAQILLEQGLTIHHPKHRTHLPLLKAIEDAKARNDATQAAG